MKIYIMLPFVDVRFNDKDMNSTAKLTEDYAKQFKTKTNFRYIMEGYIGKRSSYSIQYSNHWAYTVIQPKTLKLY